jgi:DNA topoisomerase-1
VASSASRCVDRPQAAPSQPAPPFTTSTLQQEAVAQAGLSCPAHHAVAQQLYEGVDIGEGTVGLITYMRTDSVGLANEAIEEIRGFIVERYGKAQPPEEPRLQDQVANAQEAHEAIRPTSIRRDRRAIEGSVRQRRPVQALQR